MSETQVFDPSLRLARALRRAEAARADALRQLLADYDVATSFEARCEASIALMLGLENADAAYSQRKRAAAGAYTRQRRQETA